MTWSTLAGRIGLLMVFVCVSGCGGNAKVRLSTEDVARLKKAPQIYIVGYATPEFGWWIHHHDSIPYSKIVKYNLEEVEKWLNVTFFLKLEDPTITLTHALVNTLQNQYSFRNVMPIKYSSDDIMGLRKVLGRAIVIDIKTNFWHMYPATSRRSLEPPKRSYQFQYSGLIRIVDLTTLSVIHQQQCQYPPQSRNIESFLVPKSPSLWAMPTWENAMKVSELIELQGGRIQSQINQAVKHCTQEFQNFFPKQFLQSKLFEDF